LRESPLLLKIVPPPLVGKEKSSNRRYLWGGPKKRLPQKIGPSTGGKKALTFVTPPFWETFGGFQMEKMWKRLPDQRKFPKEKILPKNPLKEYPTPLVTGLLKMAFLTQNSKLSQQDRPNLPNKNPKSSNQALLTLFASLLPTLPVITYNYRLYRPEEVKLQQFVLGYKVFGVSGANLEPSLIPGKSNNWE